MKKTSLREKCRQLPYSLAPRADSDTVDRTMLQIKNLSKTYGYPAVLAELAGKWTVEQTADFFAEKRGENNRAKNVKVIATSFYRGYDGGTERVNAELMKLWVKMGMQVVLLTEEPEHPYDFPYPESVKRYVIPKYESLSERLSEIQHICQSEAVDVFVNHNWNNPLFIWECVLLQELGIAYIQYCHAHFSWTIAQGRDGLFQPKLFQACDIVVAISETNARFYQMNGCKAYAIPNPIPSDLEESVLSDLNSKHVLMIGRLSWEKYPLEALEIFKQAHEMYPNMILDIVGTGEMERIVRDYVQRNQLENAVIFHGKKRPQEILNYYRNSDCVLLTTKIEGFSMVILEAKAHGVPVVMYDLPYLTLVRDGGGIVSAPVAEITKMASNLTRVMSDSEFRHHIGQAGRDSFERFKEYDYIKAWNDILGIAVGEKIGSEHFYSQENISEADRYILPFLLKQIKVSYDTLLESSVNYRVGKRVLAIPMLIRNVTRKVKKVIKQD